MNDCRIQSGPTHFDIDARDAQVSGNPRIAPLDPHEFTDEARQLIAETFSKVEAIDTSDIPSIFGIMFKHPGLYRAQLQLGNELGRGGCIPARERELAVLRVAWLSRTPYEWGQHLVYGKQAGLSDEEVERVTQGSDADGWDDFDRAVVRAVEELMGDYAIADATWEVLASRWSEPQLMELPGLVGQYVMAAMVFNTMRFDLLEGNTGLRRR
ncbi:alkylhydroperoxidase/carboxymuconolactone decarboxylase family protein YurZ [Novosphingobium sp. PhB165]|uniref:carboxymuconolactone decarboxylase family protein n=1 Tax=Novosphingobium sp. PhB165 TaxID=2485105 RepID=UPI0010DDA6B3|nr:carboxymuconolactone decarboxylase family protein [Novosphingobium sp. PhB165]TCM14610.1 alkylhydroperoxidase/carboxymuconolactone decarboxylase family protein YurZ [Novosphingobium sp. PhB165]